MLKLAPNLEFDHQHNCTNVLLLWCTWQLRQLGYAGRDQCRCRAPNRHTDQTCKGERYHQVGITAKGLCLQSHQEASYALTPGQPLPADAKTSMDSLVQTATATATSEPTSSSTSDSAASGSTTSDSSDDHKSGLSTGTIVGIAVGGAALLALAGGLFWYV